MTKSKPLKIRVKKVYSKQSHFRKGHYAPVVSTGVIDREKGKMDVTIRMTPELRNRPVERKVLLRHEYREASLLAKGQKVSAAHRKVVQKDPEWLKGEKGYRNIWERLGRKY